jgi:PBP1b-binding outer membrane lipoprotein LpoB
MNSRIVMLCTIVALFAGCSSSSQPQSVEKDQGRAETKKLEAASAVGYDGKAIRKSVDNTLNKNDDHNREIEKELKPGSDGEQKP